MFTGLISAIGTIEEAKKLPQGMRYSVASSYPLDSIDIGASIAHDGVCLTVVTKAGGHYQVEAWEEALRLTSAGSWEIGTQLNLERALKLGDELGGHLVSGHVDGMAKVILVEEQGDATRYTFEAPDELARFIAPKGSIALNGTSLTVNGVEGNKFDVLLIKHTKEVTTWGSVKVTDQLNIEVDTMARYAARLAQFPIT
ncbi:MAG: riboflavin synthase [Rhizobiaceae bacterium]